jgi:hypothetical protein
MQNLVLGRFTVGVAALNRWPIALVLPGQRGSVIGEPLEKHIVALCLTASAFSFHLNSK